MKSTFGWVIGSLACAPLLAACVDVEFDGAGGATGSTSANAGGANGVGGMSGAGGGVTTATSTTSTTTGAGGAAAGGGGVGGGSGCIPTTETCNGLDDDCDGWADQPPNHVPGNFCGCDWTFDASAGGRAYALCPKGSATFDAFMCPSGTRKTVLQSSTEQAFLSTWLNGLLAADTGAYVGLKQTPSSTVGDGWSWLTGPSDPPGKTLVWNAGQPDDRDSLEPTLVEDGDQDCGTLYRNGATLPALHDQSCTGSSVSQVVCEDASAQPCVAGGECLLALGCAGVFNCALPVGQQCAPTPKGETCNGLDDDCDGEVDAEGANHACDCVSYTNATTGRDYKLCASARPFSDAHCGPGYELATLGSAEEQTYVGGLVGGADALIGLYQLNDAATVDGSWRWVNGTSLGAPSWESGQPSDLDDVENTEENCAITRAGGWRDRPCTDASHYVCEEL